MQRLYMQDLSCQLVSLSCNVIDITIYGKVGLAFQDLIVAWQVYQAAQQTGIGQRLNFFDTGFGKAVRAVKLPRFG